MSNEVAPPPGSTGGKTTGRADIVIVGAGIMGCSIAWHLSQRGAGRIIVLERDKIACGSTAAAAGGVRLQFSTATNIELSAYSMDVWENFESRFGTEIGLHQQGYLLLVTDPSHVPVFQENLRLQQSYDIPAQWLTPEDVLELNPVVRVDDVIGATFCPRDGWCDPYSATMGFARAARGHGVEIRQDSDVTGIRREGDRITGVELADEVIETDLVVLCTGPHTSNVGAMAGVDIPILPYRRMSFTTRPFKDVPSTIPFTVEFARGLYVHPEGPGFLFGMGNPDEPSSLDDTVDEAWMLKTIEALCDRIPAFTTAAVHAGWAGFYEITPDDNPALGYVDGVDGLIVAAGFSGHGFMQGPAIGKCISELVMDGAARTVDISPFSPGRFKDGLLTQERNVI
jgi:sarcosine oxidase, subunit beta